MTRTALVLGGGGITGVAWTIGVLHGLRLAGTDLTTADLIVGTSAGSVVGAQIAAGTHDLEALYERQLAPPGDERPARLGPAVLFRYARAMLVSRTPEAYGQRIGRYALAAAAGLEAEADRRAVIASRIMVDSWPERALVVTAVDALTGELRAFDRESGVPVVDAVAASCAVPGVWPPVTVEGRKWIDGGMHSPANAQLAAGYDRVVVIAPVGSGSGVVAGPQSQAAALVAGGARVEVVTPGAAAKKAIGHNVLDPGRRAGAARAGVVQGGGVVGVVGVVWGGGP
ncbi:patatin-like phospholipase family protein [Streptomyces liangshanensis]|uniref:Patatin-like phospholipase family protein n=1 Tax=Streptomyces liangshanensis TaxID=2717324 RepID=A0A6G9H5V1_9ACTN|nr:patatin-like phospholipase family protein [Streptomyces liangshanensis]QIQ05912.1 patatin-like phospholipase family protein [Streptomyces liangshanensis]